MSNAYELSDSISKLERKKNSNIYANLASRVKKK